MSASTKANKANAIAFYEMAFNEHRPREAQERFAGAEYRQHNPGVGDGKESFIAYFERAVAAFPDMHVEIHRAIAEDDLVVVHCHQQWPGGGDYAAMDIFRFDADGKIVEHWDVLQVMPESVANDNGMF